MTQLLNRLERLQTAHTWMKEEDARAMLVAKYFLLTRVERTKSCDELDAAMEEFTNELVITDENVLRGAIQFANRK